MKKNRIYYSPLCEVIDLWLDQSITITSDLDSDSENIFFEYDDGSDL